MSRIYRGNKSATVARQTEEGSNAPAKTAEPTKEVVPKKRVEEKEYHYNVAGLREGTWDTNITYKEVEVESSNSGNTSVSDNLSADNTDKETAQGETESKVNDNECKTLKGTLNFIVTPETIQLKAGDTIELKNLGKYLSGLYYVQDITRNISSSGYSHSATLFKTDFGGSLKSDGSSAKSETSTSTSADIPVDDKGALVKTYTVCKGDTPYTIARKIYGDGKRCDRLFDFKTKTRLDVTSQIVVGQVLQLG